MKLCLILFSFLLLFATVNAQDNASPIDKEAAYKRTINARAEKIVSALGLTDAKKAAKLTELVAFQYKALNAVYTSRDEQTKAAKESLAADKTALAARLKTIEDETSKTTLTVHNAFLKNLSADLTPAQIDAIKNGMTYNVLNVTYTAYLDMLPNLTTAQKDQIMQWLMEARENAMAAESSDKKHWWFGKYKGRINNYLSAAGIDMKKEQEAWAQRIKAREEQKKTTIQK